MEYIVVDLEWNQSPNGKTETVKELPFEIIEIGAVKIDEKNQIVDEFNEYIRPQVYSAFHHKTQELLQINIEQLSKADPFDVVIKKFLSWCGNNYIFCTWGVMDLTELQVNMKYYGLQKLLVGPIKYYDIQKMFALKYEGKKIPHTLEYAVDFLQLEKEQSFHSAIHDARYTAKIVQLLDDKTKRNFSIDCFNNPKTKKDEIHVVYDSYSKYISREFQSKEEAIEDRDVKATICYKCGKRAVKKIKWFTSNSKNYYCLGYCKQHGFIKGKARMKRTNDNKVFVIKVLKLINEEEAMTLYEKKEEVLEKKKLKRLQKKEGLIEQSVKRNRMNRF